MIRPKQDRYGLRYKPNGQKKRKQMEKRKKRRKADFEDHKAKREPMTFPPLYETLMFVGFMYPKLLEIPLEKRFQHCPLMQLKLKKSLTKYAL